jgi:hypothetical protein
MGRKSESYFSQSKAHINFITEYRPTYFKSEAHSFDPMENIYCPRFPSLIKSDNTVWHLASAYFNHLLIEALLHKDLKCKAPLIEPNLRRNLGKWST